MSVSATDPEQVYRWARENGVALERGEHPPRRVFGEYLASCLESAFGGVESLGGKVERLHEEVEEIEKSVCGGYNVRCHSGANFHADTIILATGSWPAPLLEEKSRQSRYIANSWDPRHYLNEVSADREVLILGASQTAVDVALALLERGDRCRVTMISRRGLFPTVQGPIPEYVRQHLTVKHLIERRRSDGCVALDEILELLRVELKHAGACSRWENIHGSKFKPVAFLRREIERARYPRAYQIVLDSLCPDISAMWQLLDDQDKFRFDRECLSDWSFLGYGIPLKNAMQLLRYAEEDRVRVFRATSFEPIARDGGWIIRRENAEERQFLLADVLVNAAGFGLHLGIERHSAATPLLNGLIANGLAVAHPLGGIRVDRQSCQLLDQRGQATEDIYALGMLLRGEMLFISTMSQIRRFADQAARAFLEKFAAFARVPAVFRDNCEELGYPG